MFIFYKGLANYLVLNIFGWLKIFSVVTIRVSIHVKQCDVKLKGLGRV